MWVVLPLGDGLRVTGEWGHAGDQTKGTMYRTVMSGSRDYWATLPTPSPVPAPHRSWAHVCRLPVPESHNFVMCAEETFWPSFLLLREGLAIIVEISYSRNQLIIVEISFASQQCPQNETYKACMFNSQTRGNNWHFNIGLWFLWC